MSGHAHAPAEADHGHDAHGHDDHGHGHEAHAAPDNHGHVTHPTVDTNHVQKTPEGLENNLVYKLIDWIKKGLRKWITGN